jgi:hypothetical protein
MIAARLGLSRMTSLLAGVAMALLPLSVWRSHIGKADLGVAASALLAIWAMLRYAQELRRVDAIWFGVALAFAVSFKQSAIFIVGPLGLGLLLLARRGGQSWSHLAQDTLIVGVVGIIVWIPLNVGLWLDFRNFLEFQKVLAAMSMRDSGIQDTVATVWPVLSDRFMGPTLPLLLAFLVAPLWWKRLDVLVIWVAVAVSIVVTSVLSGDRTTAQLYAPQSVLVAAVGIMTCGGVAARKGWEGLAGKAGLIIAFVVLVAGAVEVERQALASPIHARVAEALLKIDDIANRRILASDVQQSGLPVSGDADRDETARNERLALKYGVTLPPRYRAFPPNAGRYYIRHMPWVMGGLEIYKDDDLKEPKPFAWPIQSEEWHLEYWLDQGYSVFVVKAEKAMLESKVDAYRRLHEEIRMRGMPVATIPIDRPLFNEADMKIYVVDPSAKSENRTESPAAEK